MIVSVKFTNSEQAMQRFEVSEPGTRFNFFFLVWASLQFTQLTKSAAGELAVGPRKALSFFPSPLRANLLKVAESVLYM